MFRSMLMVVATGFLAAGCQAEAEVHDLALARGAACGDLTVVVADASGTTALLIEADGLVAEALALEDVVTSSWTLPRAGVTVEIITGEGLAEGICDGTAIIDDVVTATEGFIALNVTPQDEKDNGAHVDVRVDDLVAADPAGVSMRVLSLDTDVLVRPGE